MATAVSPNLMKSTDLIKKVLLDYGGFGEVYLCYHKTLGQVVLKTVYTGPPRNGQQKQSLLEEGSLMSQLNHQRVVKLLGIILDDGDYSLVMELIPKGNLLNLLETVTVPVSVKGRIIVEILEGMVYLTENQVIHKDLKPENILVDNHFHIKIADLGLATSETWNKLTKEESRRQSRLGKKTCMRAAGTLCYMAPEHLESIHTRSTEKSDVYSFAIVVWVILTGLEPYEHARSEDQICRCVCQGDRPSEEQIPIDTPQEIIDLMKTCWHKDPCYRPTFKDGYAKMLPFYREKLEANVEEDLQSLMRLYEGPEELVEKMKSLSTSEPYSPEVVVSADSSPSSRDSPAPLRISDIEPKEASIEDLSFSPSALESDAAPPSSLDLELKLAQEYNYHKFGSRIDQSDLMPNSVFNPLPQQPASSRWPGEVSSVKCWTKSTPNQEEDLHLRSASAFDAFPRPEYASQTSLPYAEYDRLQNHHPPCDRFKSCPEGGLRKSLMLDPNSDLPLRSPFLCPPSDSGPSVYISNASAIQIGSYNTMNLRSSEKSFNRSLSTGSASKAKYNELLLKYDDHTVTDCHLEVVRLNIGSNWKQVARNLGLTDIDVETIEHDYDRDGLAEKVHQMLERWKMREGLLGFTVGTLCHALEGYIKSDVLMQLLLKSQNATGP
ncbi:receptor-interacting serine/threonine-protein kinase 1-like [Myxocyprinus asiaticus]|uniref:receptor-interacting serine/threonine-protein kinase 1-like n=1 Tax=Myxocyprinus asiaticus TaxID=70543 RepID=UPI002221E00C|nr:receptor-interacting serine/threonine-protein kinase 1-like [Myxocyprinus asiaticus]XP_051557114.1 receptor-interacting serine/threonine-protein kinase 1-like [Myxocyprinus asiaticus]XP_051557115.1 receptor-interacting serine/threonine-protein kinase 1-like [Myxocyprinus asiaticus]XP_051557116.1 receptor-interacting serine/threonine-protein kinase 1-like [Myxocyprinus asiaticus]